MKKLITYGILIVALLSSCSKRDESIAPAQSNKSEVNSNSIEINNSSYSKNADVYSTEITTINNATQYSSSFLVNTKGTNGSVDFALTTSEKDLTLGNYTLESESNNVAIRFTSSGQTWSTALGHQKGSKFTILSTRECETHSGYVKELIVQVTCALYNSKGEYIPFKCITSVKF